ncbi:SIR2 family protein [candidate division TA06 bacterium]|uniref:SIR2 family protein n=1 Tax=candidate division TA06 bacterium TaxID=2250710 RepID=A0A933MHE6_UNCT6|nr:SIR2 family protein [candidate division TA06 bacterium]
MLSKNSFTANYFSSPPSSILPTLIGEEPNIFTTNYDRFIEYACDRAGILLLDRFIGKIEPIFRTNKIELDYHYNPPGIRGEPRYVEGVVRYTKIHGSLDWMFYENQIKRSLLPFGAEKDHPALPASGTSNMAVIYPNSSKGIETSFYPYSELFRDFSCAVSQPNSILVTYGYGFGDSHINRIIEDMLIIPSTHVVIISLNSVPFIYTTNRKKSAITRKPGLTIHYREQRPEK